MATSPKQDAATQLKTYLKQMDSPIAEKRLSAVRAISKSFYITTEVALKLEKLALSDPERSVRKQALLALQSPLYREYRMRAGGVPPQGTQQLFAADIKSWKTQGLIDEELEQVLLNRTHLIQSLLNRLPKFLQLAKKQSNEARPRIVILRKYF